MIKQFKKRNLEKKAEGQKYYIPRWQTANIGLTLVNLNEIIRNEGF